MNEYYFELAKSFRNAIEDCISNGQISVRFLRNFPTGCCSYASDLLQKYFYEHNIETFYMSGRTREDSHAWIETYDKVVIDITGDQYRLDPVYVGIRNNGVYNLFELDKPLSVIENDFINDREKINVYNSILKCLDEW